MKQLSTYINEKLVLNKDTFNKSTYKYFPKTKKELQDILEQLLEERKEDDVIDLNDIDTSKITVMTTLFSNNMSIKNIDISHWNVSNVKTMDDMFSRCKNLKSVGDLSSWNVSKTKYMTGMFYNCKKLKFIGDISSWNVSNVEYMLSMFCDCKKLEDIGDLSDWNISNVENMSFMFYNSGITNLPDWYK